MMRRLIALSCLAATAALAQDDGGDESSEIGSPGVVTLVGIDPSSFNSNRIPLRVGFALAGETYDVDPATVSIFLDGDPHYGPENDIAIRPDLVSLTIPPSPTAERRQIHFLAADSQGRMIDEDFVFWTGSYAERISVVDERGAPVVGAIVKTTLSGEERISSETTTDARGVAVAGGLPGCCVAHAVRGSDGAFGAVAAAPRSAPDVSVVLRGFREPSDVDNNEFALGLEGWDTGIAPVSIVPHQEDPSQSTKSVDQDLAICTDASDEPQTVSRTFRIKPGTKEITVRYRFVTTAEAVRQSVSSSAACDASFSIDLRAQNSGRLQHETYTVSGLGASEFTPIGSTQRMTTQWREARLVLDPIDEAVQVDLRTVPAGAFCDPDAAADASALPRD